MHSPIPVGKTSVILLSLRFLSESAADVSSSDVKSKSVGKDYFFNTVSILFAVPSFAVLSASLALAIIAMPAATA